ncbi:hypothetical protein SJI19_16910 [Acerihabitans sp. TG2]|uniref:hypothetical protein n=1 Tax=Acerihabitans sp. TG2 TaxID=3096008 RepID=UPI002B22D3F4|nr:hypothetical protein [Acerihabitans sp. TG2]MEA9392207.1 hypothetical protein [Acerihabitans sp. TG2]
MSFNPDAFNQKPAAQKTERIKPERLIIRVDSYLMPNDGFHYAIGHSIKNPAEQVKVRLTTVDERSTDLPKADKEKILKQYRSGENTRDSIADKAKNNIRLISFDDSIKIGTDHGVTEYRAHWGKTISTDPNAEVIFGSGHIRLRENENGSGQAYVEMVKGVAVATPENIDQLMHDSLTIKDEQQRARDPFMAVRIIYNEKVATTVRLYPAVEKTSVFDNDMGRSKEINKPVDADNTIAKLMAGESTVSDFTNQQADTVRAIVAGLKDLDVPVFNTNRATSDLNIYHGVKQGALRVEIISFEKFDFGPDSRKTYLKDKSFRPQLKSYDINSSAEGSNEIRQVAGYDQTVVAFMRHPDGEPYVVFASPEEMWPKPKPLKDITLEEFISPTIAREAVIEIEAETSLQQHPEPEKEPESANAAPEM